MRTIAIIQARLGSTRLPRKVLMPLGDASVLTHVIQRAASIRGVDRLIVAVPSKSDMDAMMSAYRGSKAEFWCDERLSEGDVLGRFHRCAEFAEGATTIVRLTADCPLLDPAVAEDVLALYRGDPGTEYASNDTTCSGFPDGLDVEVFSRSALEWAAREATEAADMEHVTPWIKRHVKKARLDSALDYSSFKVSVDAQADLDRVRVIVRHLPLNAYGLSDTLAAARRAGLLGVAA